MEYESGKQGGGQVKTKTKGMTIVEPYGKDSGGYGNVNAERTQSMGGGDTDLSHSLSGTKAKQRVG